MFMLEWLASFFLLVGAFFLLVGALGLFRLPDFYMRLHAPTKASTLGVGGFLLASICLAMSETLIWHELLITLFVFVTAPISAHLVAQSALRLRLKSNAAVQWTTDKHSNTPENPSDSGC